MLPVGRFLASRARRPPPDIRHRVPPSRELLQSGLHLPSGEGDVRVWPPCRCNNRPDVRLLLGAGTGTVLLDVPVRPLSEWLIRTWEAVPPGMESAWIDWDAILGKLLDDR
ncbi:SsgA family sporulation/cell division regulator [Streptomyces sp. NPDC033753]|uniref:SsgA family sporulation/cell division regulator n=1 Tax=Streptomyces sp. NPDC033753 TaxID=3155128 RepID=UPI0033DAF39F